MADDLYHLNQLSKSATYGYALGTQLNLAVDDLTELNTRNTQSKNKVLNAAGLAVSGTDLKYLTANAIYYTIAGTMYTKAAASAITVNSGAQGTLATSMYAVYLCEINASGTISLQKGTDASTAAKALLALPTPSSSKAPVGMIIAQNSAGTVFVAGGTTAGQGDFENDLTAATYVDFVGLAPDDVTANYTLTFAALT